MNPVIAGAVLPGGLNWGVSGELLSGIGVVAAVTLSALVARAALRSLKADARPELRLVEGGTQSTPAAA